MIESYSKGRNLSATDFDILPIPSSSFTSNDASSDISAELESLLDEDDIVLNRVLELINDGFSGVILFGPPGTGKSWYAREIAKVLSGFKKDNSFYVQFHPAYQYEDFVEGYAPDGNGGFIYEEKIFLRACSKARETNESVIVVVDELSRVDCVRVFGEILTYIEISKRNIEFTLSSGRLCSIPKNLLFIMTMNPWDRGIEEVDLAFERRFAKISIGPNIELLRIFLLENGISEELSARIVQFYHIIANHKNPLCRIGHTYFCRVKSKDSLVRLWENQLFFHFNKVLKHDPDEMQNIQSAWDRIFEE